MDLTKPKEWRANGWTINTTDHAQSRVGLRLGIPHNQAHHFLKCMLWGSPSSLPAIFVPSEHWPAFYEGMEYRSAEHQRAIQEGKMMFYGKMMWRITKEIYSAVMIVRPYEDAKKIVVITVWKGISGYGPSTAHAPAISQAAE